MMRIFGVRYDKLMLTFSLPLDVSIVLRLAQLIMATLNSYIS